MVAILPSASVAAEIPATFFTVVDQEGVNDVNSDQVDMTQMGRDDSDQTMYKLFWSWDSTDMWYGTGQTGDACALFDSDGDGNVNYAVCARIENVPKQNPGDPDVVRMVSGSPMLFTCSDATNDRCSQPTGPLVVQGITAGTLGSGGLDATGDLITDTDPFSPDGSNYPDDSTLQVNIPKTLIPGGLLVNVCSYPSAGNGGNNNPFDCIVTPGAGFLVIVKDAGNDTTTSFPFAVSPVPAGVSSTYTIVGSGSNPPIGVVAGTNVETVTETVPTGWSLSNASCKLADGTTSTGTFDNANHRVTGITIQSGLATMCTFTDVLQPVTLTVTKNVVNDNGGTATASAFTMNVTGGNPVPGSFPGAASPGTAVSIQPNAPYSVTETGPSGYTQTNATAGCSSLTGIPPGGSAACTITNDDVAPQLTVIKHVINDNGGTAVAADFTLDSGGTNDTPGDFPGAEAGTTVTLDQGAYTVSESGPAGYSSTFSADCSGTITVGQTKTCTVTNDDIAPKLTVVKHVINDNGGTAVAGDFTMTVDDPGTNPASFPGAEAPGTEVTVDPGAYTVSEAGPAGYADSYSEDCTGTITVGQTKTCTVTNNDVAPQLVVVKHVINDNGGTAVAADFTLDSGGTNDTPDNFAGAEAPGTTLALDQGAYDVTETGPAGYAASYSPDCTGTITVGQTKTCTVTNNDVAPQLVVVKHVINDNGGTAVAGDFTLDAGGTNDTPDDFAGAEAPGTTVTLDQGAYDVTETGPSGYAASYSPDCTGTITVGQTKTCTVTNNDRAPALHLRKTVTNDNGGTALATAWTLKADGASQSPSNVSGTTPVDSGPGFNADTYTLSETGGPSGYTASAWTCVLTGTQTPVTVTNSQVQLGLGDDVTCTVTNNDVAPQLVVVKHVINDNGGTAVAADFTLDAGGINDTPDNFAGAEAPGTTVALDQGAYDVTETGPAGYAASYSPDCTGTITVGQTKTCTVTNNDVAGELIVIKHVINDDGGTATAADFTLDAGGTNDTPDDFPGAEAPGTVVSVDGGAYNVTETGPSGYAASFSAECSGTITVGQTKTCTVTNDDIAPKLTVVKHVINDNGGTAAAADFTMTVDDPGTNPASFPGAEAPGTEVTVDPGAYTVSETGPGGYADSYSADCTGTIAIGQTKTCTVTNDDIAPKLTVVKHVINDNGGTAAAADFTLTVDDPGTDPASFPGAEAPGTEVTVDPGAYTVSESGPAGYADSYSDDCTGTIAIGQTKTCTVTNNDRAPALHLRKTVTNDSGGTAAAGDWTLHANGTGDNDLVGATPVDSGPGLQLDTFALSESGGPSGYAAGDWTCMLTGAETPVAITNSQVALGLGDDVTCTINNNDIAAKLTVIKHVINDNVGTAVAGNFTMTVDDPGTDPASFPGAEAPGTEVTVDPGAYAVSETGPPGYAAAYSADCTGTLAIGQVKTCTVTNDDVPPPAIDLSITKTGPTAPVLVGSNFTYKLTVRNAGPDTATNVTVEDQLPVGTQYVSVSTTQGTCTGGPVISCSLGTVPRDGQVVITVVVKAMKTGTQVNTATVTGKETDTNPADNRATQETLVRSKLQPPEVCPIITVGPRSLPVGRKTVVRVGVGLNGRGVKGVRILIKGAGIRKTGVTNRYGRVRIAVRPRTAGVIVVRMVNKPKRCTTRRIGAVGVFQPPFTG